MNRSKTCVFHALLLLASLISSAQPHRRPVIGEYAPGFTEVEDKKMALDRMVPKKDHTVAYMSDGSIFYLDKTDTIALNGLYSGTYKGRTETWILFFGTFAHYNLTEGQKYVALSDMDDVQQRYIARRDSDRLSQSIGVEDQEEVDDYAQKIFLTSIMPILLAVLLSLWVFQRFYHWIAVGFSRVAGVWEAGCLGLMLFAPMIILFDRLFDIKKLRFADGTVQWVYDRFHYDPDFLKTLAPDTLSFGPVFQFDLVSLILVLGFVFTAWIGIGFMVSGIMVILSSGGGGTATGTSYDGGRTIHITSYTPPVSGPDIDFGLVMKYYLIYSLLLPSMYFLARWLFGTDSSSPDHPHHVNELRPIIVGVILTVLISLLYRWMAKKDMKVIRWLKTYAFSFIGFAVTVIVGIGLFLLINWLIILLR